MKNLYILLGCSIAMICILSFVILYFWKRKMFKFIKTMSPDITTWKQAKKVLTRARTICYEETGIIYTNIYDIKAYLIKRNLLPIPAPWIPSKKKDQVSQSELLNILKEKSGMDLINEMFRKLNLPKSEYLTIYGETKPTKTVKEVYSRTRSMRVMAQFGYEMHNTRKRQEICDKYNKMIKDYSVELTEFEKNAIRPDVEDEVLMEISWYVEGIYIFEILMGHIEKLVLPVNSAEISSWYPTREEIDTMKLDENLAVKFLDMYYAYAWTIRDQMLKGNNNLSINSDVVFERYKAILWLFDEENTPYNEIEIDT